MLKLFTESASSLIVTYGGHGCGKCAAQLREVLSGLKMHVVETMPALTLSADQVRGNTGVIDAEKAFAGFQDVVVQAMQSLAYACTQTSI